jgi:hypothetical protein
LTTEYMNFTLSTLAIILGLGLAVPQLYGFINPTGYAASVRKFPRSLLWGFVLMLLGTCWFLYNLSQESIADFASWKNLLFAGFAAVGIGACVFVQDFLAVRGLAVVLLLLAKLMVDTGRPHLGSPWVALFQAWAYLLVTAGIWLTVSPWRLRDLLNWATANEKRVRLGCGIRLAFGLLIAALGFTVFKG